ncbi:tRNA lysidine(34) synthetase TilS [Aquisalimonas asiatica]|uniref:tRNA(Ile)-lysidine synthase n=1 Tax=Aquisalimonas asiatica TaxID=406100 RepID=A0A1H8QJU5_9GAMM|nr:tRNA lysidine(34) synthetase TilS [Aquisalimonas asiatica]SEO54073.1 tRNA(Ile)-lysidine synthase [Aquisalimonas asiatica]
MDIPAGDIADRVISLGPASAYRVAFSGGPDSHVLLHALARARHALSAPLSAIHVNHRMHADADAWETHCQAVCQALRIPLTSLRVPEPPPPGAGETWARDWRYRLIAEVLADGECLLTAHHQDDQAETVLLRMLRGSGVDGLAGIPRTRALGRGWIGRPLLEVPRGQLTAYARDHGLYSIDDPANQDWRADRNRIRHDVLPRLLARWPGAAGTIARTGLLAGEASASLGRYAAMLLEGMTSGDRLDGEALSRLPDAEQRLVLRQWLQQQGVVLPDARQLEAARRMLMHGRDDRMPVFHWPGGTVRRYRGWLSLGSADPDPVTASEPVQWLPETDLRLDHGWLRVTRGRDGVAAERLPATGVTVVPRQGGERCRPVGRPTRPVKKLFQEAGVPPWQRRSWPLVMVGDVIAAVPGLCVCEGFQASPQHRGLCFHWDPD